MKRTWTAVTASIIAGALLITAALVTFSCTNGNDLFEEYRGVNLIEGYGFDSGEWTADRSESYYMNFEAVTEAEAGGSDGLPAGAAIYRLEIPNLMPNGDFEATTVGNPPAGWTLTDADLDAVDDVAASGISGKTLDYDLPDKEDIISYSLNSIADSFYSAGDPSRLYLIRFNFVVGGALFDYNDSANSLLPAYWTIAGLSGIQPFPTTEIDSEILAVSSGFFSINTPDNPSTDGINQSGLMDNFRIIRTDISYGLRLQVPAVQEGRLDLIPGTYRFSVYIKQEEASSVTPTVLNTFRSSGVTLQMKGPHDTVSDNNVATAFHPDDEDADWSSWSLISADIDDLYPSAQEEPDNVIVLSIYPHDVYNKDIGRILISAPSLEFIPEGSSD